MDTTTVVRIVFLILVFPLIFYGVFSFFRSIKCANARRRKEYEACQHGLDNQLRVAGHTEEYVEKAKTIRALQDKRRNAKIGYYAAWIGGILCLIFFPPIGLFLTGFAIIMTIREGRKLRKEMHDTACEIKGVRQRMPEK